MDQTTTPTLPDSILVKLNRAAELTHCSVDEIAAATVEAALTANADLPDELQVELAAMRLFSDDALWAATHPSISTYEQQRLAQLNDMVQERSLTQDERAEQQSLLRSYNRSMLRRAEALALLKQRGHEVTQILEALQDA